MLAEYSLDRLGAKPVLRLPIARKGSESLGQGGVPSELQEKVASLLASESSRKVQSPSLSTAAQLPQYIAQVKFNVCFKSAAL